MSSLERLQSFYKDNDPEVYAHLYINHSTNFFEVHFYDEVPKEEPPVGLFVNMPDAVIACERWVE